MKKMTKPTMTSKSKKGSLAGKDAELGVDPVAALESLGTYPRDSVLSGCNGELQGEIESEDCSRISVEMAKLSTVDPLRRLWREIKPLSRECGWRRDGESVMVDGSATGGKGRKLARLCGHLRSGLTALCKGADHVQVHDICELANCPDPEPDDQGVLLQSPSGRVKLRGPLESPTVDGKRVKPLNPTHYRLVEVLLQQNGGPLTLEGLNQLADTTDASARLRELEKLPGWEGIKIRPGKNYGKGYRIE